MTTEIRPEDFPRGISETNTEFPELKLRLGYGEIFDAGLQHYGEFFANLEYGWDLIHRDTVTLDGRPGRVQVVQRCANGVQLKWWPR